MREEVLKMGDQQMYKMNQNDGENMYYQQQHLNSLAPLNHNYGTDAIDTSQDSSLSPSFPHDSIVSKSIGLMDSPRQASWTHLGSGNHLPIRNNQNVMWSPPSQGEPTDGYEHLSPQSNEVRLQKITSGALHKLDSFAQVFANQNLRIQVNNVSQIIQSQPLAMENANDSALRQLLSQKPALESQPVQRYQQVPPQVHQGFTNTQPKQHMHLMQHQQPLYYDNQQHLAHLQMHPAMNQGQAHLQQMHSQHLLPQQLQQDQYYLQEHPPHQSQHRLLMHEMQQQQQQRQCTVQRAQYYPVQPMMQQLQQQQQQQMQMQLPPYHRDPEQKPLQETHPYSHDRGHSVQLIQLGAVPQYFYQDQQQSFRQMYPQSLLQPMQPTGDTRQSDHFQNDDKARALMESQFGLPGPEGPEGQTQAGINSVDGSLPHQPLISPASGIMNDRGSQELSPSTVWPQIQLPDDRLQSVSPEQSSGPDKETYTERPESKNKLTCSVCLKEFKSLPALNGHMRSHGGLRTPPVFRQEEGENLPQQQQQHQQQQPPQPPPEQLSSDLESFLPIVMPVSVPVKLPSPESSKQAPDGSATAKDKPVSDDEMPVLVRMTYSPPASPKAVSPCASSEPNKKRHPSITNSEEGIRPLQDKKKSRHRPEPLFIPPPSFSLSVSHSGATLYQSQLRSPRILADHLLDRIHNPPPYTPPPMLSPVRQGSGLFSSVITSSHGTSHPQLPLTPLTPTPRVLLCRSNSVDGGNIPVTPGPGEQTIDIEPRINIGSEFQADIPELKNRTSVRKEEHRATLVWKPLPEREDDAFQERVTNLLNMCCSSVLTGGGTNLEYGLHSLFEAKGNVMAALEMLLLLKPTRAKSHPLANYHYAGSDRWTPAEKKLFNKALSTYGKDFILVQKMVKSKTVAQCVEYYYTWKKIMHLGRKHRTRLAEVKDEHLTSGEEDELEEEELAVEDRKSVKEEETENPHSPDPPPVAAPINLPSLQSIMLPVTFSCEMPDCGAMFSSRQALNGHVRIHSGANAVVKARSGMKQKLNSQNDYSSVKTSPAHSTTSGETDPPTVFPCKECGKMFFKIKSRNAHMKTHRQQEEQQRQKAQKAAVAAEMAATIARTTGPTGHGLIPLDHLDLIKQVEQADDLSNDVVQELGEVIDSTDVIDPGLLLGEEDTELLQDDAEL
nr:transcriptional-regulating factor 1 isoform X1 [Pogona vitticeps]XP_020650278.1 transcriptional-regulating factor 1 isoform X1 [Pogona vitticeps]XP_020650279.1 transcriptional-regulating factor 1 isoform X1 [Pogona vitticeps]XP_020650280.1 transcriptional-regulating factor 1 isoform X1 [Pogona vitticeps]